jgi:hypothetical protein
MAVIVTASASAMVAPRKEFVNLPCAPIAEIDSLYQPVNCPADGAVPQR